MAMEEGTVAAALVVVVMVAVATAVVKMVAGATAAGEPGMVAAVLAAVVLVVALETAEEEGAAAMAAVAEAEAASARIPLGMMAGATSEAQAAPQGARAQCTSHHRWTHLSHNLWQPATCIQESGTRNRRHCHRMKYLLPTRNSARGYPRSP